MTVSLPENKFDWDHNAVFARQVIDAVRSLPSVRNAAVIQGVPMRGGSFYHSGTVEGYVPASDAEKPLWRIRVVSPGYWDVMQIPIIAGRPLDARDEEGERGFPRSIVVSHAFTSRYWPGENAIGNRIGVDLARMGLSVESRTWWMTVVGVAGDVRYGGLEAEPTVDVYYPQGLFPQAAITLIARTRVAILFNAVSDVRARIRAVDQDAFVTDVRSMDQLIAGSQAERRAGTLLVGSVQRSGACVGRVRSLQCHHAGGGPAPSRNGHSLGAWGRTAASGRTGAAHGVAAHGDWRHDWHPRRAGRHSPHALHALWCHLLGLDRRGSELARSCSPPVSSLDMCRHGALREPTL